MSATTMHFGPEWMRTKHQPLARSQPSPSPPLSAVTPAMSTYSALVSPVSQAHPENPDEAHPFRYSKSDLLRIYREGTKGGLALEVERWEGVVRELGSEPIGLREMGDAERKLFTGPLNSDLRRRQSTDYLSPLNTSALNPGIERPRIALNTTSATGSPSRERFGTVKRRDSNTESPASIIPRKQSLSTLQTHSASPRNVALPSPRTRAGFMPNFDGVLNNGDSWTSRRRASEASLKSGAATYRDSGGDWEHDDKNSGIREEKEEEVGAEVDRRALPPLVTSLAAEHTQSESRFGLYPSSDAFDSESRQSQSHLGYASPLDPLGGTVNHNSFSDVRDLAGVEWSYKDPTGQVQGPFRADLMQKWYDDGYFSVDLPMKRTHLDSQWITVEKLAKLVGGDKIFLSPFVPALPPGLSLQNGSPLQPLLSIANQNVFSHPYQPAPVRSLRSSTLDSYLGSGSNPSESPSSSFGAGRFGDSSPDPSFGGRASNNIYFGGDSAGLGYSATPDSGPLFASRRPNHDYAHDPALASRSPSFGNIPVGQGPLLDVYERVSGYAPTQGPWSQDTFGAEPTIMVSSSTFNDLSNRPTIIPSDSLPGGHRAHQIHGNGDAGNPPNPLHEDKQTHGPSNTILGPRLLSHSPVQEYLSAQQSDTGHRISPDSMAFTLPSGSQGASPIIAQVATPWKSVQEESQSRRPGPFEVPHPTSTNTISVPANHAQPSPWGRGSRISRPSSQSNEPSPWVVASQGILEDPWKDPEPSGLTVSNVGQHNQQHQGPECPVVSPKETPDQIISSQGIPEPARSSEDLSIPTLQSKITTPIQQSHPKPTTGQVAESPAPTPPTPKVAWIKEEEKRKSRAPGVSLSLREIQEAEAKKAESRKAAERERERAARGSTTVDGKEDVQPFTASWGLPTSQTGARGSVSVKEAVPAVSAAPNSIAPPVWTTAVKPPAAKTMKEIQEEEEKRKKLAIKETTAAATAKRAYADSTVKVVMTPNLTQSNNAWATVGPSGKILSPALTPVRPTVLSPSGSSTPINSSPSVRVNGARSAAFSATVSKPTAPVPKAEDFPATPSHDFLKWLSESLKGLNKTVNVEEIMAMLLSFSLDPDPSTIELISDTIYEHSTTLDGRRFASDFVSKRKADAAARPKGANTTGKTTAKPVSIADVVKATPKTAPPEWGFKIVNKKKKGNRA